MHSIATPPFLVTLAIWLGGVSTSWGQVNPNPNDPSTIFGIVMELRSGTPDVPVCLCDAATGIPLLKDSYKPIDPSKSPSLDMAKDLAIVVTDKKGSIPFRTRT